MPKQKKKKKNTYEVEGEECRDFATAAGRATDLSLERREAVVVLEHGQTGTYAISITAQAEQVD
jgi:hypothetical protein